MTAKGFGSFTRTCLSRVGAASAERSSVNRLTAFASVSILAAPSLPAGYLTDL